MPYDLVIIGSGPAGLSAGLYAGRYRMKTLVIGDEFGGAASKSGVIWNYPGNKGIDGYELMSIMRDQAREVGTEVVDAKVTGVKSEGGCFEVSTSKHTYNAKSVLFAVGTEHRKLGLPNEKELLSKGVHTCATCDAPLYSGKTVAFVGGGDASVKSINLTAEYVDKIYFIIRSQIKAEPINVEQMKKLGDKVMLLEGYEVKEIVGEKHLEKIILSKPYNGSDELVVPALFVEIGSKPNVEMAVGLGVELDETGHIKTDLLTTTNVPGVFAAGDATNLFNFFKQDITAAAMGAVAATASYNYTKMHGNLCMVHMKPAGTLAVV